VGENEIVPSMGGLQYGTVLTTRGDYPLKVDSTDFFYANTYGDATKPELAIGRIVGNSAAELLIALETSIAVAKHAPGYNFNRSFSFCVSGYPSGMGGGADTIEGMLDLAGRCPGLEGVELVGNWHVNDDNIGRMPRGLSDRGLVASMLTADLWTQAKWGRGSLAAPDAETRAAALAECRKVIEWAEAMGKIAVDLWFGQDGYDYPFQSDYEAAWGWLVEGVQAAAAHRPSVPVCIEYKLKEPRTHIHVNSAAKTLLGSF
jgi:hypothetical protein